MNFAAKSILLFFSGRNSRGRRRRHDGRILPVRVKQMIVLLHDVGKLIVSAQFFQLQIDGCQFRAQFQTNGILTFVSQFHGLGRNTLDDGISLLVLGRNLLLQGGTPVAQRLDLDSIHRRIILLYSIPGEAFH